MKIVASKGAFGGGPSARTIARAGRSTVVSTGTSYWLEGELSRAFLPRTLPLGRVDAAGRGEDYAEDDFLAGGSISDKFELSGMNLLVLKQLSEV